MLDNRDLDGRPMMNLKDYPSQPMVTRWAYPGRTLSRVEHRLCSADIDKVG